MVVCCESSTYQVYHGVVSVPIYQSNDIVGSLITIVSYVITKQQPLQGYFVRLNLRIKYALSVRITGDVCTYLASFVRGKGTNQRELGGCGVSG